MQAHAHNTLTLVSIILQEERDRRSSIGAKFLTGTGALMAVLLSAGVPPSTRAVVALPLFFGVGFTSECWERLPIR